MSVTISFYVRAVIYPYVKKGYIKAQLYIQSNCLQSEQLH